MKKLLALALFAVVGLSITSAQAHHRQCCPDYNYGYYYYEPVVEYSTCCPEIVYECC